MTKAVNKEVLDNHLRRMGFEPRGGRAVKASELNIVNRSKKYKGSKDEEKAMKIKEDIREEERARAARETGIVSPHCVRVHDSNGRQIKGRRWIAEG